MLPLKPIGVLLIIICYGESVSSVADNNHYCTLESRCVIDDKITSSLHIGCPKSFANSPSLYKLIKLKHFDREFITNEFNQFRSDITMGVYSKIFKHSVNQMNQLEWSHELEYLLSLMISKVPNTNFYCMATEISNRPSQLYVLIDRPRILDLRKIFMLAINEIKVKALESFRDANIGDIVNWSQIYNKDTWAVGCALGEFTSMNVNDKLLIRCSFYGQKLQKKDSTTNYNIITSCSPKRRESELFFGLCVKDELEIGNGDQGEDGRDGLPGLPGPKGEKGDKGFRGRNGHHGLKGIKGDQGNPGEIGDVGQSHISIRGDIGENGICSKGNRGNPGLPGYPGEPGAIGLIGDKGVKGEPGENTNLAAFKGDEGVVMTGSKGEKGEKGDRGDIGLKGLKGQTGIKGEPGTVEYEGEKCITCPEAKRGKQGPPGPPGPKGSSGTLEIKEKFDITTRRTTWF